MARDRASISTTLWADQDWRDIPKASKYLYMMLLSHPTLNYAGVADWRTARLAAMSPDDTVEDLRRDAAALQEARFIFVDEETEEVLIRSFLRHDGLLKQPKLSISMVNAYGSIASKRICQIVTHELQRLHTEHPTWAAFGQEKVLALVKGKGTDIAEFTPSLTQRFDPAVTPGFTLTPAQADPLPTTTATTTTTSSKEDKRSSEISDEIREPEIQRDDVDGIVGFMTTALRDNDVKFTVTKSWTNAARLLLDKDGYTAEQIKYVISFAVNDPFWNSNILSLPKLRAKFETLKKQAIQKSGPAQSKPTTKDKMMGTIHLAQQMQQQQLAIGSN